MYSFPPQSEISQLARLIAVEILAAQQPATPAPSKWVTFAELREILNCSDDTVTRRIKKNGIPTWRDGRGKKILRNDLPILQ